jgi:threonine dehydratase
MQFCPGATAACDEGLADKPEKMISLPDGGGFFIKGIATAAELYPPSPDRTEASR